MISKVRQGSVYACHHGPYAGQMFCFIMRDKKELTYNFLRMPDMITTKIPQKDFDDGLKNDIIKYVEKVPKYVFKVIEAQYKKNENTNDRRK
jgi:hypothetical protein|tara:strand:+ start:225 stop:500 length:276 start_codon:yes stop_codon:yes gene_type:complete